MLRLAPFLALFACLGTGCAVSQGPTDGPGWLEARGADFLDMFGVRLSLGAGLGAYARATEFAQLGFMKKGPAEQDLPAPQGGSARAVPCVVIGNIGRYGGMWFESSTEGMLPGWSTRDIVREVESRPLIVRENISGYVTPHGEYDDWRWSLGLGLHLIVAGLEAELRPLQIVDFFAGIAGFDPAGDDLPPERLPAATAPARSQPDSSASS